MTDDEIDAAILAALKLPATNVFPVGDDERIIFLAGYRAGIEAAAELPACRCTAGLFAEGEQLSHWQTRHQTAHSNRRPTLQERTMTDRDNIELPPLPPIAGMPTISAWIDELRIAAVLADRERRAKVAAKPVVYSRTLHLTDGGHVFRAYENTSGHVVAIIRLRWTSDGKAWIDSEKNRELARRLRSNAYLRCDLDRAADALDGGVR